MGLRYTSPLTQVIIVGFICFLCPGMFNALNVDASTGANGNTALYSTFVVFGIIGGGIVNLCGVRWTIFGSGFTYALYSASYIYVNETGKVASPSLLVPSSVLVPVFCGLLRLRPSRSRTVSTLLLSCSSALAPFSVLLLLLPRALSVTMARRSSWSSTPMSFGAINGAIFNLRTRGFNNIIYWGAQMVGAYAISFVLDNKNMNRKKRGIIGFAIVAVFFNVMWGGTLALQKNSTDYPGGLIDFKDSSRAGGPITLYFVCGLGDALYQSFAYWVIGALTNDKPEAVSLCRFLQGYALEAKGVDFMGQLIGNWVLFGISLPTMAYVVWNIKDHSEDTVAAEDEVVHEKEISA
ncbi:hypothetical protein DL89DRAFT_264225 [Linderina pennispora]|uniref:MFS general substrate transporter n=1 Tax=Linderina pennispora TaxID=61395 RepID=A0A1Y1WL78_9FUNG|nr:uncharacterized protein DL89DRAFT_264225 [Linderina pennispora]ORX74307.1 hypothetical protein DL89DRAFT_264225 [Linderina pennispora]